MTPLANSPQNEMTETILSSYIALTHYYLDQRSSLLHKRNYKLLKKYLFWSFVCKTPLTSVRFMRYKEKEKCFITKTTNRLKSTELVMTWHYYRATVLLFVPTLNPAPFNKAIQVFCFLKQVRYNLLMAIRNWESRSIFLTSKQRMDSLFFMIYFGIIKETCT